MKKILTLIILISLLSTIVIAGDIHRIDLNKNPTEVREINEGDLVEISLENKTHKIILKRTITDRNIINVALFVDETDTPSYISLGYNQQARLDFYNDRVDDMVLILESLSEGKARIIFKVFEEKDTVVNPNNPEAYQTDGKETNAPSLKTGIIISAAIIIIGLILAFIFLKK